MGDLPTVKVRDPAKPGDFKVINESDFDPEFHELWGDAEAKSAIDIRETRLDDLAAALAEISDLSVIQAAYEADDRKGAVRHYKVRIAELTDGGDQ